MTAIAATAAPTEAAPRPPPSPSLAPPPKALRSHPRSPSRRATQAAPPLTRPRQAAPPMVERPRPAPRPTTSRNPMRPRLSPPRMLETSRGRKKAKQRKRLRPERLMPPPPTRAAAINHATPKSRVRAKRLRSKGFKRLLAPPIFPEKPSGLTVSSPYPPVCRAFVPVFGLGQGVTKDRGHRCGPPGKHLRIRTTMLARRPL